jgi:hypothetical protein
VIGPSPSCLVTIRLQAGDDRLLAVLVEELEARVDFKDAGRVASIDATRNVTVL